MELKVIENDGMTAVFEIKGTTPAFLNGLRRTLLSQVPKLAIDDVTIYDNTSALFDEMVSHRLGLLPVPTDLGLFVRRSECTCNGEGCANCTVLFTLSKEGPAMVLSGDLVPAADQKFRIADPKVPIVKLLEGQRVMLEAGAVLGSGIEHAKWQAVTAVGYTHYPTAKVTGPLSAAAIERAQRTAPAGAVTFEGNNVRVVDPTKAAYFLKGIKEIFPDSPIEVGYEQDRFVFTVETDGSLTPVVALRKAVSILMEKLKWVEADAPKLEVYAPATPSV